MLLVLYLLAVFGVRKDWKNLFFFTYHIKFITFTSTSPDLQNELSTLNWGSGNITGNYTACILLNNTTSTWDSMASTFQNALNNEEHDAAQ